MPPGDEADGGSLTVFAAALPRTCTSTLPAETGVTICSSHWDICMQMSAYRPKSRSADGPVRMAISPEADRECKRDDSRWTRWLARKSNTLTLSNSYRQASRDGFQQKRSVLLALLHCLEEGRRGMQDSTVHSWWSSMGSWGSSEAVVR